MRWIFHVGFPKCASTSIQAALRQSQSIHYCGRNLGKYSGTNGGYVVRQVIAPATKNTLNFAVVNRWRQEVEAIARSEGHDTIVISDEKFTGLNREMTPTDTCEMLLSAFGPSLELRFVIRNHWSLLRSNYKQKVKVGAPFDWTHFCFWVYYRREAGILRNLNFHTLFRWAQNNNVSFEVFLFERLVSDPDYFASMIASFGIAEEVKLDKALNASPDDHALEFLRDGNLDRLGSNFGSLGTTTIFNVPHEIDRKDFASMAESMGVESPTLNRWLNESRKSIQERRKRIADQERGEGSIDWSLPKVLEDELECIFRSSCDSLGQFVGEDCRPYGYLTPIKAE